MCIMEVRAGQRLSTIMQACAHNVETVRGDIRMSREIFERRDEHERITALDRAQGNLDRAFADLLELFGEFVAEEEAKHGVHFSAHEHPGEDGTHEHDSASSVNHEFIEHVNRQIDEAIEDHGHLHPSDVGRISHTHGDHRPDEGTLVETAHHDAELARRFETR